MVHGLWMRGHLEMWPLRQRLSRAGFEPRQFSYSSVRQTLAATSAQLWAAIEALHGHPFHLVAHSLGGIIVIETLHRYGTAGLQRVVTLGSPLTGSLVARRMDRHALTRWPLGQSREALINGAPSLPAGIEIGSIAGNKALGLGRLMAPDNNPPGDGSVSISETRPAGLADHITLPLTHSGLQMSALAARQTIAFLRNGCFEH